MLWLCLHFSQLPLEVFSRSGVSSINSTFGTDSISDSGSFTGTDIEQRPVVIAEHQRVCCANSAAQAIGIRPGQPIATAIALQEEDDDDSDHVGKLHILERNPNQEMHSLQQLASWCYQFTPMVSLKPPDAVLLEITGSLKLFKGLDSLLKQLRTGITTLGYCCDVGLAPTPKAAWLFSQKPPQPASQNSLQTPATKTRKTATSDRIAYFKQQLATIPVHYLEVDSRHIELLKNMGIEQTGQLLSLPRAALGKRFGKPFIAYLQQLIGEHPDPQLPIQLPDKFQHELFYIDGMESVENLLFPIKRLLNEFCCYLQGRQLYCRSFSWKLKPYKDNRHEQEHRLDIELSRPQNHSATFLTLTRIKLEQLELRAAIHSIHLSSEALAPAETCNYDLLSDLPNTSVHHSLNPIATTTGVQNEEAALLLLNKLCARLGNRALLGLKPQDEAAPELSWRYQDFQLKQPPASKRLSATKGKQGLPENDHPPHYRQHYCQRPAWLLPQPIPLKQQGRQLYWQNRPLELLRGPERIDSHWWQQPIQRDYFIARQTQGGLYWLFREVVSRRWFIQGIFY